MKIPVFLSLFLLSWLVFGPRAVLSGQATGPNPKAVDSGAVIQVAGDEQQKLNLALPDGGLPLLPGVLNLQLLRTTRDQPLLADGDGWTYAHHMDLAEWKGRLYAAWNMTPKDEDVPPSKVVYATSENGIDWSRPADLFPRDLAWACRFYFYRTQKGRMLAFSAARLSDGSLSEDLKSALLVREIFPDHGLGSVYTLIHPLGKLPPIFETSPDQGFVEACREAAGNNLLLEQQDYGMLLGDRRMKWHSLTPPFKGFYKFGKGFSFFQRQDRQWVGISKMGFVTLSADQGRNWSEPVLPPTLIAGSAKIWGQQTPDSQYLLAYNPDPQRVKRFPLVMVHGDDGIHFQEMRVVHGEFPPLRYPGKYKDPGFQYVRGIAPWSSDRSFADRRSLWLIYSVHKEDLWLSRIPLPLHADPVSFPRDDFQSIPPGALVPDWNLYSPKWAPVRIVEQSGKVPRRCLELRDADPADHAGATRLFPATSVVQVRMSVLPFQSDAPLEIEIQDEGGKAFVRIRFTDKGQVRISSFPKEIVLGEYVPGKWHSLEITAHGKQGTAVVSWKGKAGKQVAGDDFGGVKLQRLILRTGSARKLGDTDPLGNRKDQPLDHPAVFRVDHLSIKKMGPEGK